MSEFENEVGFDYERYLRGARNEMESMEVGADDCADAVEDVCSLVMEADAPLDDREDTATVCERTIDAMNAVRDACHEAASQLDDLLEQLKRLRPAE